MRLKSEDLQLEKHWDNPSFSEITLLFFWHGKAFFTPSVLPVSLVILRPAWEALQLMCTGSGSLIDQYVQAQHRKWVQANINLVNEMCQKWRKVRLGFDLFNLCIVIDFYRGFCSFTPIFIFPLAQVLRRFTLTLSNVKLICRGLTQMLVSDWL